MTAALRTFALWAIAGALITLALVTTVPSVAGYRALNVLSGSMEPELDVGGVVLDESIRPASARPGDVITFPDPDDNGRTITHRVEDVTVKNGRAYFVTRGDSNAAAERWDVALHEDLGRVRYHLPKVGYARSWLSGGGGRWIVAGLMGAWLLMFLRDLWGSGEPAEAGQPA